MEILQLTWVEESKVYRFWSWEELQFHRFRSLDTIRPTPEELREKVHSELLEQSLENHKEIWNDLAKR